MQVWHHNMIVWALGLVAFAAGALGLCKEIRDRIRLASWLREEDEARVAADMEDMRVTANRLPPWHKRRFLAKKHDTFTRGKRQRESPCQVQEER